MKRRSLTILGVFVLFFLIVGSASAGKGWCKGDPTADINGVTHHFEVAVLFPEDGSGHATGATEVWLSSPRSITNVHGDSGIDGLGEVIHTGSSRINTFAAKVPANGSFQMALFYDDTLLRDNCVTNTICTANF